MKLYPTTLAAASIALVSSAFADVPAPFKGLFEADVPVKAEVGMVLPPKELNALLEKVQKSLANQQEWFKEYSKNNKPGSPLPYDEKLGLTKAEYDQYINLWNQRSFKAVEQVILVLRNSGDSWTLVSTGNANPISALTYNAKDDAFKSPNGTMKRIEDINASPNSSIGAWTASEWRCETKTALSTTRENIAIGRYKDQPFGLVVYRSGEYNAENVPFMESSLLVRFPLGKAGQLHPQKAPEEQAKPAAEKAKSK